MPAECEDLRAENSYVALDAGSCVQTVLTGTKLFWVPTIALNLKWDVWNSYSIVEGLCSHFSPKFH
jgi:hypothetical protein